MHTDEHNTIRYLMKEMDPSEEAEFEKQIREDKDLLIEVESLRSTKRKLSSLPLKNPPKELINQVLDDVNKLPSQKSNYLSFSGLLQKGLAAAILLSVSTAGYFYFTGETVASQESAIPTESESVEPWVDRNEILRYNADEQFTLPASIQSDFTKSYEKLQLVNDPSANGNYNNSILLTGSSN